MATIILDLHTQLTSSFLELMAMVKILDCLFKADRYQQPYGDGRDVDKNCAQLWTLSCGG